MTRRTQSTIYPPEVTLLLACTRRGLNAHHIDQVRSLSRVPQLDWVRLAALAQTQGIAPLLWTNLQRVGLDQVALPTVIAQQLQQATYQNIAVKTGIIAKVAALIAFCQARDIAVMAIKGLALDLLVYEQPWYTVSDVDLILRTQGGPLTPQVIAEVNRFFWPLPGFEYEWETHHDVTMNGVLAVDFAVIWRCAAPITVRGQPLWVMDPVHMLLTACINSGRKRFFRLKQLLAIASLLEHYPTLAGQQVAAQARAYGCTKIVYAALRATQATIGCPMPVGLLAQLALHPLRTQLIDGLIAHTIANRPWYCRPTHPPQRRSLDTSLLLPYATYEPRQLLRKLGNVMRKT